MILQGEPIVQSKIPCVNIFLQTRLEATQAVYWSLSNKKKHPIYCLQVEHY